VYAALIPWVLTLFKPVSYHVFTYGTELLACKRKNLFAALLRRALRGATKIYVLGAYGKTMLQSLAIPSPIIVEPPRLDITRVQALNQHICSRDIFKILCVGRLVAHKGHTVLLKALAILAQQSIPVECNIVGDGPAASALAQMAAQLLLQKNVILHGAVSDATLDRLYMESTLFVLPSLISAGGTEGFGIVLLEAMASRLPIIASNAGGIPEVLENGACGILVKPDNPEELAQSIKNLLYDKKMQEKLADAGYQRLMSCYVWK
jgi:glycosyltransferase involved in cell wall biosynthesis